jgi:hypothetical protein
VTFSLPEIGLEEGVCQEVPVAVQVFSGERGGRGHPGVNAIKLFSFVLADKAQ